KARGAYVIGTASAAKHDFLRELGADEVVDYRDRDVEEIAHDVDAVLDTLGGDTSTRSLHTLRPGGIVVSLLPVGSGDFYREADELGVRAVRMLVDSSRHELLSITDLVEQGALRATIAEVVGLDQAAEAHRRRAPGRTAGQLVLTADWPRCAHRGPRAPPPPLVPALPRTARGARGLRRLTAVPASTARLPLSPRRVAPASIIARAVSASRIPP